MTDADSPSSTREIVKLLRALATGTDHQKNKHDVIFTAAADALTASMERERELEAERRALRWAVAGLLIFAEDANLIAGTTYNGVYERRKDVLKNASDLLEEKQNG